jgi:Protein of unknown function (DUF3592)
MNWIGLTIFVILPAIGAVFALRSIWLIQNGVRVPGTIVDYKVVTESRENGPGHSTYHFPVVRFSDTRGRSYTETMATSDKPSPPNKRKPVRMIYPKNKPEAARIENFSSLWLLPIIFCCPALIYGSLMAWAVLRWWLFEIK